MIDEEKIFPNYIMKKTSEMHLRQKNNDNDKLLTRLNQQNNGLVNFEKKNSQALCRFKTCINFPY